MSDLEKSRQLLLTNDYTCVLCKDESVYTSFERGVKPLVSWLESDTDLRGFSASDKVVGKGAAFLYIQLGVRSIYANVISTPALNLLKNYGIAVEFSTEVMGIINRKGDGICPFELTVLDIDDPEIALKAIRNKMNEMNIRIN